MEGKWDIPKKWIGNIAKICKKGGDECNYIIKIIRFDSSESEEKFWNEVKLQKKAFTLGVAPEVSDAWICRPCENIDERKCPYMGSIIIPTLKKTLKDIFQDANIELSVKKKYFIEALIILRELNQHNIVHNNPNLNNFMIDFDNKLKIIDFSHAEIIKDKKNEKLLKDYKKYVNKIETMKNADDRDINDIIMAIIEGNSGKVSDLLDYMRFGIGVRRCKKIMKDLQNVLVRPRDESYVSDLQKYKSEWETGDCWDYDKKWINNCKKCLKIKNKERKKIKECEHFRRVSNCRVKEKRLIEGDLFVAYDSELKNVDDISCLPENYGVLITPAQLNFYTSKMRELSKEELEIIMNPNICLGLARTGTTNQHIMNLFFVYRILPILSFPKTMALIPRIEIIPITADYYNTTGITEDARQKISNQRYPILPSWNIQLITDEGIPRLIKFLDPKNVEIYLEFNFKPSVLKKIDWSNKKKRIDIAYKVFENPFELIDIDISGTKLKSEGKWEGSSRKWRKRKRKHQYYGPSSISPDLNKRWIEGHFDFNKWISQQKREVEVRQEILKLCISNFKTLYHTTKAHFPGYRKYGILFGEPTHFTSAIFDDEAKRTLYYNGNGQFFWTSFENSRKGWRYRTNQGVPFFLSKVIEVLNEKTKSDWQLDWNFTNMQTLPSCGLHSLTFFWYGCCNSIETIQRFWNFSPRKQEEQEITNEEKEVYWTFIEVLVNQLTELTRFLMKTCFEKCQDKVEAQPPYYVDTGRYGSEDRLFDVLDTINTNTLAKLVDSRNDSTEGKFSYIGWGPKWDEWIDMSSSRITRFSPEVPPRFYANLFDRSRFYDFQLKADIINGKFSYNDVQAIIKIESAFQKLPVQLGTGDFIKILMRCDLSSIELGNEIQKLVPTTQFLERVFGLKIGRGKK